MAYDALTTSGINNLVNSFKISEQNKRISPLNTRKTYYQNITSAYSQLSSKLDSLKSILSDLKSTSSDAVYYSKSGTSSNTSFLTINSSLGASDGSYSVRINQLAKNDLLLSNDLISDDASSIITMPGTYDFEIKAGDGNGGEFVSKVSLTLSESDFTESTIKNSALMQKIQNAINSDSAVINSSSVAGSTLSSGSFVFDLNGTETTINYEAGNYSEVIDSIVSQLNEIDGISAEKTTDGGNVGFYVTGDSTSNYIGFGSDTGTLLSELGISEGKEKAASGIVTASLFSPVSGRSQLSVTAKNSGYDYRITSIAESGSNGILESVGLNLGTTRQEFVQNEGLDTAGFLYTTTLLNSKIEFNGINIERSSNSISDLIDGSTIQLKSVMQEDDTTVNLTVSKNVDTIKNKVQDFITKFNEVYTYIKNNLKSDGSTRALFAGDTTASSILTTLSSFAYTAVSGIPSNQINSLSKLGITFNVDTGLSLSNTDTFNSVVENRLSEVITLLTAGTGIASTMYDRINPYLGSSGYITKSRTAFDNNIKTLTDSITSAQNRIDKNAEMLRQRYITLQMQLAELMSYQNYFSSTSYY
ncbi:MAG TPA: flagellar filament capping protein FliD [Melioribacteraceae bacterium]|nr:flagellar filament capping protein FliD [Melioribacteraceae bacterium]